MKEQTFIIKGKERIGMSSMGILISSYLNKNKKGQIDFEETLESPGFWILAGGGIVCVIIGWIVSKKIGVALPLWQLLIILIAVVIASALFSQE
jgi:uncharacterized protein (DUF983 family)